MRVLFSCTAGDGHFMPTVPLARAFAAAGHDVVYSTAASCTERVAAAGFENLPAGPGVDQSPWRPLHRGRQGDGH